MEAASREGFALRLSEAIGDESVNNFAKRCGVSEGSVRNYLKDKIPGADIALKLADTANVSFEWLVAGRGSRARDAGADFAVTIADGPVILFQAKSSHPRELALIPRLDIQASAGNGAVPYGDDPLEFLAFQSDWLRGRGINPSAARILTARGDSMEETIRDGDILLVDTSVDRVKDNAIYVVSYGEMVLVKRIHGRINGSYQLISDNPRYPAEEVAPAEAELLNIAGRVVWSGRSM